MIRRLVTALALIIGCVFVHGSSADALYNCRKYLLAATGYTICDNGSRFQRAHLVCYDAVRLTNFVVHGPWVGRSVPSWATCNYSKPAVLIQIDYG